jgi:hypothetical protein
LGVLACAQPPDYPPDDTHLRADTPRTCYDCHHEPQDATTTAMHPSHFEDDGSLKSDRKICHNCHQPSLDAAPDSTVAS